MPLENFASPGLRWGLLLVDHPGASHEFELVKGSEIGFPQQFGGDADFCVCTITFPERDGEQHAPVSASKEARRTKGESDEWVVICTKTLGRALKKAGYPDDLDDLKDLMLWRKQNAQVAAIESGRPPVAALPAASSAQAAARGTQEVEKSLQRAKAEAPPVPVPTTSPDTDHEIADAELVDDDGSDPKDFFDKILDAVNALSSEDRVELRKFLAAQEIPPASTEWTNEDLDAIDAWLNSGGD